MGKTDEASPNDPSERLGIDQAEFTTVSSRPAQPLTLNEETDVPPVEPAAEPAADPDALLEELLRFHIYGEPVDEPAPGRVTPALLYPYRDLSRIRHDYPICLNPEDDTDVARPLGEIVDAVIASAGGEGDEGERMRRHILRLEVEIRRLAESALGAELSELWDTASQNVLEQSTLNEKHKEVLEKNLAAARAALEADGEVHDCRENVPARVFAAVMAHQWRLRCAPWREDLVQLTRSLEDILRADASHSQEALSPEHLRASTGKSSAEEVDFEAMSEILSESHLGEPIPDTRRQRIQEALHMLHLLQPLFLGEALHPDAPVNADAVTRDCASALEQHQSRMRLMTDFFRAVRIARIEVANGYRESVHDPFFRDFDASFLTEEELAFCPPVLLVFHQRDLTEAAVGELIDLLNSGVPVKVLVVATDLLAHGESAAGQALMTGRAARLASVVTALNHVFVLQCPVSSLSFLKTGFAEGYGYAGPAFFSVYTGDAANLPNLPLYLNASAALESRSFPAFRFDPGRGATWAQRMDIGENPQCEANWPSGVFTYRTADGQEQRVELPFTLADFLAGDRRLASHFLATGPKRWHENMVPYHDYARMDDAAAERRIPYITGIDSDGNVCRVVVSRQVVDSVAQGMAFWRNLQELGGVDNSFALELIAREKERLEEEKAREVAEIEATYASNLERDIGELTREIVQRIAARLMTGDAGPMPDLSTLASAAAPATAPKEAPAPQAPAAPAPEAPAEEVEEDEDEVVSLDDPYIDTPLCTSCNDCFEINNRLFAYDDNKQAYITDPGKGTFRDLVMAAELCPVKIIHPGKPKNPDEPGLDDLVKRAAAFN